MNTKKQLSRQQEKRQVIAAAGKALAIKEAHTDYYVGFKKISDWVDTLPDEAILTPLEDFLIKL